MRSLAGLLVDGDVEERSLAAAHQLVLGMGRGLEVQPADRADLGRERMVVLAELDIDPLFGQCLAAVAFGEKPTVIAEPARGDQPDARQRGIFNLQGITSMLGPNAPNL